MSERIITYLTERSAQFQRRADCPRVAWDQIGAEPWAKACLDLAERVRGMSDEAALAALFAIRDDIKAPDLLESERGALPGWYYGFDFEKTMTDLLDPIGNERVGYIALQERVHTKADGSKVIEEIYKRERHVNGVVSVLRRGRSNGTTFGWLYDETDEAWAERKRVWFSRYNSGVWVTRGGYHGHWAPEGRNFIELLGTVESYLAGGCAPPRELTRKQKFKMVGVKELAVAA